MCWNKKCEELKSPLASFHMEGVCFCSGLSPSCPAPVPPSWEMFEPEEERVGPASEPDAALPVAKKQALQMAALPRREPLGHHAAPKLAGADRARRRP